MNSSNALKFTHGFSLIEIDVNKHSLKKSTFFETSTLIVHATTSWMELILSESPTQNCSSLNIAVYVMQKNVII